MSVDRIELVCDDPRHDGRLGEVETFVRIDHDSTGEPLEPFWYIADQYAQRGSIAQDPMEHHRRRGVGEPVYRYVCDLCPAAKPQQVECTQSTQQWLLNAVAVQGVSQPTLRLLNLILSNRT